MRRIVLLLPLAIAVAAMFAIALTRQHQPNIAEATDDVVEIDFIIVANPGDAVGTPWTEAQVENLISGANDIYAANATGISFNWPKQDNPDPALRFTYIDDPQKAVGGPGDVKTPPLSAQVPYVGEHLPVGQGTGSADDKSPEEALIICINAWANANPGTLPVALVQQFTDLKGAETLLLGAAYTNIGTNQPGVCILMSVQTNDNPQTFAHELGHVLCLAHADKTNNLMQPVKTEGDSLLNPAQVAQLCPKEMQQKLLNQPGKIPTPTPTPNLTPTPVKGPEVSALCRPNAGPDDPIKCKYDLFQTVTIVGDASFAQDTDKNGVAGYHGVQVKVTWPPGLGGVEKSSDVFCPPGGVAGKLPAVTTGTWTGVCSMETQADPPTAPACPIQPDLPFPDPGCDTFDSFSTFDVNLTNPSLPPLHCELSGAIQITRSAVISGALDLVDTEIVSMQLTGLCDPGQLSITVVESPTLSSVGQIVEQKNNVPGVLEFPADSFFDVYVVVQGTPPGDLHNNDPIIMKCTIDDAQQFPCPLGANTQPALLNVANDKVVGAIKNAAHTPKKTLEGPSLYEIQFTCLEAGAYTVDVSATFTREDPTKDLVGPVADSVDINCNAPPKLPYPGDTDGDGCPDERENQPKSQAANGGGRNYLDPYDWYDVNQDGEIDLFNDILGVILHYSLDGSAPYDVNFDRGPTTGPNAWNMTAPDGVIDLFTDILGVIQQHGHACT